MGIGLIAVAKNQVMFIVSTDSVVGGFVILLRQRPQLVPTCFRLQFFRIKDGSPPLIFRPVMGLGRTIAIEVADQIRVVLQLGAVGTGNVIHPLSPIVAEEVEVHGMLFPLVRFHEGQKVAVRHFQRLIFVHGEGTRVPPFANRDFLNPAYRVEAPLLEVGNDGLLDPFQGAAIILVFPDMNVLGIPQRGRINVIHAQGEKRFPFRSNQQPAAIYLPQGKKALGVQLSCFGGSSPNQMLSQRQAQTCGNGTFYKLSSVHSFWVLDSGGKFLIPRTSPLAPRLSSRILNRWTLLEEGSSVIHHLAISLQGFVKLRIQGFDRRIAMRDLHVVQHLGVQILNRPNEVRLRLAIDRVEARLTPIIGLFRRELIKQAGTKIHSYIIRILRNSIG